MHVYADMILYASFDGRRKILPDSDEEFFDYVRGLDCSQVKVYGVPEGTIVFPRVPVLR